MKYILNTFLLLSLFCNVQAGVITCYDASAVGSEAKMSLHAAAQKRAQKAAEDLVEKKIVTPYVNALGQKDTPEMMAAVIEAYWCNSNSTPLHSAYFSFYTSNKHVFE
jgi:hypothetical protein